MKVTKLNLKEYATRRSREDTEFDEVYSSLRIIAELIKSRFAAGITQEQLADRMGVARPRVAEFEAMDGRRVSLEFAAKYARALGTRIVLEGAPAPGKAPPQGRKASAENEATAKVAESRRNYASTSKKVKRKDSVSKNVGESGAP